MLEWRTEGGGGDRRMRVVGGGEGSDGGRGGKDEAIGWVLMWKGCMSMNALVAAATMTYIPNK